MTDNTITQELAALREAYPHYEYNELATRLMALIERMAAEIERNKYTIEALKSENNNLEYKLNHTT